MIKITIQPLKTNQVPVRGRLLIRNLYGGNEGSEHGNACRGRVVGASIVPREDE